MNKKAVNIFAAISDYVHTKPSWVLVATYKMYKPKLVKFHSSKAILILFNSLINYGII